MTLEAICPLRCARFPWHVLGFFEEDAGQGGDDVWGLRGPPVTKRKRKRRCGIQKMKRERLEATVPCNEAEGVSVKSGR